MSSPGRTISTRGRCGRVSIATPRSSMPSLPRVKAGIGMFWKVTMLSNRSADGGTELQRRKSPWSAPACSRPAAIASWSSRSQSSTGRSPATVVRMGTVATMQPTVDSADGRPGGRCAMVVPTTRSVQGRRRDSTRVQAAWTRV